MLDFIQKNPYIIGAFTGSLATYLLTLLVNYLKREKKVIGYSVSSRKIVEREDKEIEIKYRGHQIDSLYSHQVIVRNIGNRALRDLKVQITCDTGKFVEENISCPKGAKYFSAKEDEDNRVTVNCDLINKGELFTVGLSSIDSRSEKIVVVARGEDLVCKEISQEAKFFELLEIITEQSVSAKLAIDITRFFLKLR